MKKSSSYRQLSNILSGLELNFLNASDRDILSSAPESSSGKIARSIIADRLESRSEGSHATFPDNASERRRLFELLTRSRSSLPKEIRMAYGTGRSISDGQVSTLLRKLLRRGFLGKPKSDGK
jgi:hypothetical protein